MVREGKRQEESSAHWKRGGHPSGTLIRLQQRVHKTVEDWLDCYRVAVGTYTLTASKHSLSSFSDIHPVLPTCDKTATAGCNIKKT